MHAEKFRESLESWTCSLHALDFGIITLTFETQKNKFTAACALKLGANSYNACLRQANAEDAEECTQRNAGEF